MRYWAEAFLMFTLESIPLFGAGAFGMVLGWMAYHVFKRAEKLDVTWLGSIISVLLGGAISVLFKNKEVMFGSYTLGLAFGFFLAVFFIPIASAIGDEMERDAKKTKRSKQAAKAPSEKISTNTTPAAQEPPLP
jgi:hypothetical protein